jgi:hypothetical protein
MTTHTSYDTSVGARNISAIESALKACIASNSLVAMQFPNRITGEPITLHFLRGAGGHEDSVPSIVHPFHLYDGVRKQEYCVLDMRPYGQMDTRQGTFKYRDKAGARLLIIRGLLEVHANNNGLGYLRDLSILPAAAFSRIISQNISFRYNLDPGQQIIISIVSAYYYYCLFAQGNMDDEDFHVQCTQKISRACNIDATTVNQQIRDMGVIQDLSGLVSQIKTSTGSVQLEHFDTAALLQIITGLWFGAYSREIVGVGLEHAPTWVALCYASVDDATFSRSRLADTVQKCDKSGEGERLTRGLGDVVDQHTLDAAVA